MRPLEPALKSMGIVVIALLACVPRVPVPNSTSEEEGLASYYANSLEGRRTANGESYQAQKLTAAHRTLPFGSCVVVQNTQTQTTVQVRINDRGPFVATRIIDVSFAAAQQLGMLELGVIRVRISTCARAGLPAEQ